MKKELVRLTITIPPELKEFLKIRRKKEKRTMSDIIEELIQQNRFTMLSIVPDFKDGDIIPVNGEYIIDGTKDQKHTPKPLKDRKIKDAERKKKHKLNTEHLDAIPGMVKNVNSEQNK